MEQSVYVFEKKVRSAFYWIIILLSVSAIIELGWIAAHINFFIDELTDKFAYEILILFIISIMMFLFLFGSIKIFGKTKVKKIALFIPGLFLAIFKALGLIIGFIIYSVIYLFLSLFSMTESGI